MGFIFKNLTDKESREIAETTCKERNWPCMEPVRLVPGLFSWTIRTNADAIGANVEISVSRMNKKITRAVFLPR